MSLKVSKQKEKEIGSKQHAEGFAKCTKKKIRRNNENTPIEDNIGDGSTSLSVKVILFLHITYCCCNLIEVIFKSICI